MSLEKLFNRIKKEELEKRLISIEITLPDIQDFYSEVDTEGRTYHYINVDLNKESISSNVTLETTKEAFKQLIDIFNLQSRAINKLDAFNNNKGARMIFIKSLKALAIKNISKDKTKIFIHFERSSKLVHRITNSNTATKGIPTPVLFDSLSNIFNDNPNLDIDLHSVEPMQFRINVRDTKNHWSLSGFPEEDFTGGFTVIQDIQKGTFILPYTNRSVCTNGLIGPWANAVKYTKEPSMQQWRTYYEHFETLRKNNYKSPKFEANVKLAMNTKASFAELLNASKALKASSITLDSDSELFIPLKRIIEDYSNIGVDLNRLDAKELSTVVTPYNIWEIIQVLTDFASNREDHSYEINADKATSLQKEAGEILGKKGGYDLNKIVTKNPYN